MRNYNVTPEFKNHATQILSNKKFTAVFPFMNLINREGFIYNEQELNGLVQMLGEFPYNEVAEFFQKLPTYCTEQGESESTAPAVFEPVAEEAGN